MADREFEKNKDRLIELGKIHQIILGSDVKEFSYPGFPVLGSTPIVPFLVEYSTHGQGRVKVQLALFLDDLRRLVDQGHHLLEKGGSGPASSPKVH